MALIRALILVIMILSETIHGFWTSGFTHISLKFYYLLSLWPQMLAYLHIAFLQQHTASTYCSTFVVDSARTAICVLLSHKFVFELHLL